MYINKKKLIIIYLFLNLFLVGCDKKEDLYSLKENYIEITNLIIKYEEEKSLLKNYAFDLIEKEMLNEDEYNSFCKFYGEGFNNLIQGEINNTGTSWWIIEYESEESAQKAYKEIGNYDNYLYKNIIIGPFYGRLDIMYDVIYSNSCRYVNQGKILISCESYLSKFEIDEDVEIIESYAFRKNVSVEEVVCNEKLLQIGFGAFTWTNNLKKINLNDRIQYIGKWAFYDSGLEYIVIPRSVEFIGSEAFNKCNVFCEAESKPSGWADDFITGDAKVYYKGEWEYNEEGIPKPLI